MSFTVEKMRARFWEATAEKEALAAKAKPARAKREELRKKLAPLEARLREANAAIAKIERPGLAELDGELARLARALGNKVGERPEG